MLINLNLNYFNESNGFHKMNLNSFLVVVLFCFTLFQIVTDFIQRIWNRIWKFNLDDPIYAED